MKTVLEVIQATTAYFEKHGVESARLNIEHLLAHVLGLKRMELYLQFDRALNVAELEPLRELVRRRAAREPLQHLLGTVEFLGRTFASDARALIPRPETEQLCAQLIAQEPAFAGRLLDIGTGSGVIALSLATAWPEAQVEAVDLSLDALALARENAARLGLAERVRFLESDLLAQTAGTFQLMVANLPYIAAADTAGLEREVQRDPQTALIGGPVGTEIISRLIAAAPAQLQGRLVLEIGLGQADAVCAELARHNYQDIEAARDYQGVHRFVFAKYG